MWGAFFIGILLQAAVTEIPFLTQVFCTAELSMGEWAGLILVSAAPLILHEILTLPGFLMSFLKRQDR